MTLPPLTAVALSASPAAPQPANTMIKLTATPSGGGGQQIQYLFRVGYADAAGWHWTNLTAGYTTTATCSWTPTSTGTYTLVVWARITGHTANYDKYQSLIYQITTALTAVALSATPGTPQPVNTAIKLTAMPTGGGGQVQYLFRVGYADAAGWHWTNLTTNYTTTATCSWTPVMAGTFTLVVWARLLGHTANYDNYASVIYQVTTAPKSPTP